MQPRTGNHYNNFQAWSTLLRTLHSVLTLSHPDLLSEVIVIDDGSTLPHLHGDKLERYLAEHFPGDVVKLIRSKERKGLVGCRED